jgi:hypothetical protein
VYVFCLPTSSSGLTCDRQRDLKRPWHEDIVFIPISRLLITKFSISSQAGSQEQIVILAMMALHNRHKKAAHLPQDGGLKINFSPRNFPRYAHCFIEP